MKRRLLPRRFLRRAVLLPLACCALFPLAGVLPSQAADPGLSAIRHVQVGDISIGYRVGGSGFPLLMVMGRGGTMADWDPQLVSSLMREHRVIVFDNRGVATTANPSTQRLTIAQMATDTVGLLHALGIGQADLLGWSMGGYVVQTVALQHPSVVRRLVLAATDPGGSHTIYPPSSIRKILDNPHLPSATLFALCFPPDKSGLRGAVRYFYRVARQSGLQRNSFTFTAAAKANQEDATSQWKAASGGDYPQLPTIQQPTLVADGRGDLVVPIANARLLASRIPHARLLVYPNAGHAFLFQDSAAFGKAVLAFLR